MRARANHSCTLAWCCAATFLAACSDEDTDTGTSSVSATTGESDGNGTTGSGTTGNGTTASTSGSATTGSSASDTNEETTAAPAPCSDDAECVVLNDCCRCAVAHVDDAIPACEADPCFAPLCDADGLVGVAAQCLDGSCAFARFDCDPRNVDCDAPEPECSGTTRPKVIDRCWSGECVGMALCEAPTD